MSHSSSSINISHQYQHSSSASLSQQYQPPSSSTSASAGNYQLSSLAGSASVHEPENYESVYQQVDYQEIDGVSAAPAAGEDRSQQQVFGSQRRLPDIVGDSNPSISAPSDSEQQNSSLFTASRHQNASSDAFETSACLV